MHAAGILARTKQAVQLCGAIHLEFHAAHHVMRGWHHLHQARHQIKAAVGAALDHALEFFTHHHRIEMRHGDIEAAVLGDAAFAHFLIHAARYDVTRGALVARIVEVHEAFFVAVQQITARAT